MMCIGNRWLHCNAGFLCEVADFGLIEFIVIPKMSYFDIVCAFCMEER